MVMGSTDRERTVRMRTLAAGVLVMAAVIDVVSALTPSLRNRLDVINDAVPLAVPRAAHALTALAGIGLLQLARGVRRGQRHAWALAMLLLLVASLAHIVKGLDLEEAAFGLVATAFLLSQHRHFHAAPDRSSLRRGLLTIGVGAGVSVAVAVGTLQASRHRTTWPGAVAAVLERLAGIAAIPIGGRLGAMLTVTLAAVGFGLAVSAGWLLVRPALRVSDPSVSVSLDKAREAVARYGGDTLSYFALRDDKLHVRLGDTLIAYAVHSGVCLVSPDPIGPANERAAAWSAFRDHATHQGWSLAVLGAGEDWLAVYRDSGMSERYIGDEAIVDCPTFSLHGGAMKGLRQAVNRVANHGYTISFHDPATIEPALADSLRALMCESRRGEVERGFSMTLSRLFDRRDIGLLMAVCHTADGHPAAFAQYVPARDIGGYSLDLMRRSTASHPNGLTDFVIVRTIQHLAGLGHRGLSLNFAAMRALLAGEMGDGRSQRMEKRIMERLSETMQIESLWRYNAKFGPAWRRRYLVYDSPENLLAVGLAVARAEQWWELPVVGRFLPTGLKAIA
jgi:lysylphosphatidylglycerol synthetase-like protein (DUF2156 family)